MINADDFTYSKGYLGLLSALGASLGIIFCCVPSLCGLYFYYRNRSRKREVTTVKVDEESIKNNDEDLAEGPLPMTDDSATKTHGGSARFSVDCCGANSKPPPDRGIRRNHTF